MREEEQEEGGDPVQSVLIIPMRRIPDRGSQIPYPNAKTHDLNHSRSSIFSGNARMQELEAPGSGRKYDLIC